ncbi:molybdopterin dinucleotide binding domain-containing protein [Streptomyces sp. UP1A-1]|nr:molybdopterin dinucleotide binding domain-containing protein [Streptomyces sp. UP1A-1]
MGPGPGTPRPPRALRPRPARPARGPHRRGVPDPADHGTAPRLLQHRCPERWLRLSLRRGESVELCPEDAERYGVAVGEEVRVTSRRGSLIAPVWVDTALRPGLAFMSFHFPDEVDTNQLTIEANCPIAGTAEFKASAIRIEKVSSGGPALR